MTFRVKLLEAVHDKHRLDNRTSTYHRAWAGLHPYRVKKCSNAIWIMLTVTYAMKKDVLNCRCEQLYNKLAFMRKQAYMSGEGTAKDRACPLCRQKDAGGHVTLLDLTKL